MEKAITAETQQLQREICDPTLAGAHSVHMKLPGSIFRGLQRRTTFFEPDCKKYSNLPVMSLHLQIINRKKINIS